MAMPAAPRIMRKDFRAIIEANRETYLNRHLDLKVWKELSDKVAEFDPQIIILQPRRMPRLHKLLKSAEILDFKAEHTSEFAVPFCCEKFRNRRVAIIDDTVNGGHTLAETFARIGDESQVNAFAMLRIEGGGSALDAGKITYMCESLPEAKYREASARTALALWLANEPFECEFPLFKLANRDMNLALPSFLCSIFGEDAVHRLDIPEAPFIGYARYSVDLGSDEEKNDKLRFYEDLLTGEMIACSMADRRGSCRERYRRSKEMGEELIKAKLGGAGNWEHIPHGIGLLFGAAALPEAEPCELAISEHDFMARHWPLIKKRITSHYSSYECFYNFFIAQRDYIRDFQKGRSGRVRLGPTFADLLSTMKEIWQPEGSKKNLRFMLSQMLDEQIDRGFVVPEGDVAGYRIYREGEPAGNDTEISQLLESMGIAVRPVESVHAKIASLTEEQKERLEYLRRLPDSMQQWD